MPSVGYEYYDQGNFYSTPVAKLLYDLATLLSQVSDSPPLLPCLLAPSCR